MKFVIFTNKNSFYGKKMVQQLELAGVHMETVVIINQPLSYHIKLFNFVKRRVGILEAIIFSVKIVLEDILKKKNEQIKYTDFKTKIIFTNGTNSASTESILKNLNPDILILAQTGIVRKNILSIPKFGVLNCHPAILPYYRGIDCHKWAILNDEYSKIGSTLHWVDAGVDTGNIISSRHYEIKKNETVDEIEKNLYLLCISIIKDTLLDFINGNVNKGRVQVIGDGKQYYKMSLNYEKKVKAKLSQRKNNSKTI